MKEELLPDHHVLRYCSPLHVRDGKIKSSAFAFHDKKEFVSVNWMEYFSAIDSIDGQVQEVYKVVSQKLKVKTNGRFARLNVGKVKGMSISDINIKISRFPEDSDPSHAGIYGYKDQNGEIEVGLANMISDRDIFRIPKY